MRVETRKFATSSVPTSGATEEGTERGERVTEQSSHLCRFCNQHGISKLVTSSSCGSSKSIGMGPGTSLLWTGKEGERMKICQWEVDMHNSLLTIRARWPQRTKKQSYSILSFPIYLLCGSSLYLFLKEPVSVRSQELPNLRIILYLIQTPTCTQSKGCPRSKWKSGWSACSALEKASRSNTPSTSFNPGERAPHPT